MMVTSDAARMKKNSGFLQGNLIVGQDPKKID